MGIEWIMIGGFHMVILENNRLKLVQPDLQYLEAMHRIHADPSTNRYNPGGPHESIEQTREMLLNWMDDWTRDEIGYFIMIEKASNDVIGMCGVRYRDWQNGRIFNLAYRLDTAYTRKGYTKEANELVLQYIHDTIDTNPKIVARTKYNNIPSIKTAEALGLALNPRFDNFEEPGDVYLFNKGCFA